MSCLFCDRVEHAYLGYMNEYAVGFLDGFPLNPGHTLVVPRRHVEDLFDLHPIERAAVWALVDDVHADLVRRVDPVGFNVGLNVGAPGGQTIDHAHVHVIPRVDGDGGGRGVRGGVRWVVPERAAYWDAE